MERNLQLNWSGIVEEAVKRRKSQGLTQKQFAVIVGVSGPTVNRFEQGSGNITLKSAFAILQMLGMLKSGTTKQGPSVLPKRSKRR